MRHMAEHGIGSAAARVGPISLVRAGLVEGRRRWRGLLLVAAVTCAASFALLRIAPGLNESLGSDLVATLLTLLASSLVTSGATTASWALLLKEPSHALRGDRLLECMGILLAATLLFWLPMPMIIAFAPRFSDPAFAAQFSMGALAFWILASWICLKLYLWPVGRLLGRREMTIRRSWRLTNKATLGFALAHLILLAPLMGGLVGLIGIYGRAVSDAAWGQALQQAATAIFLAGSSALTVALFRLRVLSQRAVAEIFS
jgi:hypothetical protein